MATKVEARAAAVSPPDFKVAWEHPNDERLSWLTDRMHFPEPITPLDDWLISCLWAGANRTAAAYGFPFSVESRRINTYAYFAIVPDAAPPSELAARERGAYNRLETAIGRLGIAWETELLPEVKGHLAAWEAFDPRGASSSALPASLDEMTDRQIRLWEMHDLLWTPMGTSMSLFDDLYRDLFGGSSLDAYRLLQGFDTTTLARGRELRRLSRRARATPEVRRVLAEQPAAAVPEALGRSREGRDFLDALRAHLEEYGRCTDTWGVSSAPWIENPTPVVARLQADAAAAVDDDRDPEAELAALAAQRERLVIEARAGLRDRPQSAVDRFEFLLRAAQEAIVLSEDHGFWIDAPCAYHARRLFLECGRRLTAAGVLAGPGDVFYLTLDEVREALGARSPIDRRAVVAGRQAEMAYYRTIAPPPVLGAPPPPAASDDPLQRTIEKFFGAPPEPNTEETAPTYLRGNPGSQGTARGRVRIVRSVAEGNRLRPGDVLVAATTSPAWTPLFGIAAAIVTDTGGVLSHCAVVAREYGLPAVVGVGTATTALRDGQMVEVDGTAGLVRILADVVA